MGAAAKVNQKIFDQVKGLRRQGRTYSYIVSVTKLSTGTIMRLAGSESLATYRRDLKAVNAANYQKYYQPKTNRAKVNKRPVPTIGGMATIPLIEDGSDLAPPTPVRKPRAPRPDRPLVPAYAAKTSRAPRTTISNIQKEVTSLTRQVTKLLQVLQTPVPQPQPRGILGRLFG